jgi:hypothetical protein
MVYNDYVLDIPVCNGVQMKTFTMGNRLFAAYGICLCTALVPRDILGSELNEITVSATSNLLRFQALSDSNASKIAHLSHASRYNSFKPAAHACQVLGGQSCMLYTCQHRTLAARNECPFTRI